MLGDPFDKGRVKSEHGEEKDFMFAKKWSVITEEFLAERKIQVHSPKVGDGGLDGVLDGLELLKNDKVSGEKLVYNL